MFELISTRTFDAWIETLRDRQARQRIAARLTRLQAGNPGDVKALGEGISELRIDYGPGYRIYFTRRGPLIVLLLCGGDKSTQAKDIKKAIAAAKDWKD
jgi:putative addiction module killer protein